MALVFLSLVAGSAFGQVKVTLAWTPSSSTDVTGYRVYYGTASGTYTAFVAVGNTNRATITNLTVGTLYYFAAKAVDTSGNESVFSNEVSYTPTAPPILLKMALSPTKQPVVTGTCLAGLLVNVQASGDLKVWTTIGQTTADVNGAFAFTDTGTQATSSRYYRVLQSSTGTGTQGGATTLPSLQITTTPNGDWLLSGTGPVGASFAVLASRDFVNWSSIGTVTVDSTGSFQFVAPAASGNFFKLAETQPAASTTPVLQVTSTSSGDWLLSGTGPAGAPYAVEASKDLVNWNTIGSLTIDSSGSFQFLAPATSGNFFKLEPQ